MGSKNPTFKHLNTVPGAIGGGSTAVASLPIELAWDGELLPGTCVYHMEHTVVVRDESVHDPDCLWNGIWKGHQWQGAASAAGAAPLAVGGGGGGAGGGQ